MLFGKHLNKYYLRNLHYLIIGVFILVAVDYFQLLIPGVYGAIIDGLKDHTLNTSAGVMLNDLMIRMFIILIVMVFGRFGWRICFFFTELNVETCLRQEMFDHCKDLSQNFYSTNKVGNLMSLFTNDIETIKECVSWGLLMMCDIIGLGTLALYHMFSTNVILTLLTLIPLLAMAGIGLIVGKYLEMRWDKRQEAFSNLSDYAQESFSGLAVIRAFVREANELHRFKKINKQNELANVEFVKLSSLMDILVGILVNSVLVIILGYGGYLVYTNTFSVGTLIEFSGYFTSLIWPMMAVGELINMTSRGRASLKRVGEFVDTPIDVVDKEDLVEVDTIKGDVSFNHLTFRYNGADYDALSDVSFDIKAGENIGIIGKTGCGKTTIVDLLLRTYNVEDNTILVDGIDVNKIAIKKLREYFAYVPQDNFLFSELIKDNIAFSSDDGSIDMDKVKEAAILAGVDEDIEGFNDKYDTLLGERGVTVSGGQKQRISIARALMKNASVLILDDSLSAVDTKTETTILANLAKTRKGKTTILIAHRVSTVEKLDRIMYMEEGKLLDMGTHEELIARCVPYAKLVELQRLESEEGGNA